MITLSVRSKVTVWQCAHSPCSVKSHSVLVCSHSLFCSMLLCDRVFTHSVLSKVTLASVFALVFCEKDTVCQCVHTHYSVQSYIVSVCSLSVFSPKSQFAHVFTLSVPSKAKVNLCVHTQSYVQNYTLPLCSQSVFCPKSQCAVCSQSMFSS
jgi:tetrahydromethanopterin S-methyltransferase subunit E